VLALKGLWIKQLKGYNEENKARELQKNTTTTLYCGHDTIMICLEM
jgi:hypothetical protein